MIHAAIRVSYAVSFLMNAS